MVALVWADVEQAGAVLELLLALVPLLEIPPDAPWENFFDRKAQYGAMLRALERRQGEGKKKRGK